MKCLRKRNTVLLVITLFIILALTLLLLFSLLLIWGRVMAPKYETSVITVIWKNIKELPIAKGFMNCLRQAACFDAWSNAARNTEGRLEPLSYAIALMGCVSFLVSTVNEIKSTRSFGMLMSDVIYYAFPFHLWVQLVFHAAFAVAGWYSCEKNIGIAGAACLLGILICFFYSLIIAWFLLISPRSKEWLVNCYIRGVIKKEPVPKKNNEQNDDTYIEAKKQWQSVVGVFVLDYARYIGQQWRQGNILQIYKEHGRTRAATLISLAACGLALNPDYLKMKKAKEYRGGLRIPSDFNSIFIGNELSTMEERLKEKCSSDPAGYVLFKKSLHYANDYSVKNFNFDIRRCVQIWDQLFFDIEDDYKKAKLAYIVLVEARMFEWHMFTLMVLGLLSYLGVALVQENPENEEPSQNWHTVLTLIRTNITKTIPEEKLEDNEFYDNWAEIMMLAGGVIEWKYAFGHISSDSTISLETELSRTIQGMTDPGRVALKQHIRQYIALSYLLYSYDNSNYYKRTSAVSLQMAEDKVRAFFDCI